MREFRLILLSALAAFSAATATDREARLFDTARHSFREELVAGGLDPWGLAFLPDGRLLVTEKKGRLGIVNPGAESDTLAKPVRGVPSVFTAGQGGLMDVTLHPDYDANGWIYLAYSEPKRDADGNAIGYTVIARARLTDDHLSDLEVIYRVDEKFYTQHDVHFGSRIVFDGDGYLHFSIGDRGQRDLAQSLHTPNGKMHRLHADGRVPVDNPFAAIQGAIASIWSYGHRNPQGVAVHPLTGEIWITEHGPRGGDELNLVHRGVNYGWPIITYGINYDGTPITDVTHREGMEQPVFYWNPSIAVCGIDFYDGDRFPHWKNNLLVTALAFKQIRRVGIEGRRVIHEEIIYEPGSRVRDVETGPDGLIYAALEGPGRVVRLVPDEADE